MRDTDEKPEVGRPLRPVAVELFAGAGGLSLGVEQAGFDVAVALEFDPIHAAIHHLNFPHAKTLCSSVEDVSGVQLLEAAGLDGKAPDLLLGGPPCQGFSLIGQRVLEDPRNSLVFHFLRLVEETQPRFFVMENVPGMATGARTQLLHELIRGFEAAGYHVVQPFRTLNAAAYGVPQLRERLFLMGAREGEQAPRYPSPWTYPQHATGNGRRGNLELDLGLPYTPTVSSALEGLPTLEWHDTLFRSDQLQDAPSSEPDSLLARRLAGVEEDPDDLSYPRSGEAGLITGCRRAKHTELSVGRFRDTRPGETEPVSRFFRLPPDGYSNTLRAGTSSSRGAFTAPRPIHPVLPRCITVREAARLHSFPDWFRFHATIWHGFRQVGNSVPPYLGRAVGSAIVTALGRTPSKPVGVIQLGDPSLAKLTMRQAAEFFDVDPHVIAPRKRYAHAS